jgi:uncharacterized protein involved in exopolysaccharide biosynthesis
MGVRELLNVLRLRKLIVLWTVIVGVGVGFALALVLPTKYVSAARVQVDSIQRNSLTGDVEPRVRVAEYLGQQAAVASSRAVALEVLSKLTEEGALVLSDFEKDWREETGGELVPGNDMRDWAADKLLDDLTVTASDIGSTLDLAYRADEPAQAARVANAFASSYMSTVLDQKQRRFSRKAANFSEETQALARDVADAQAELADFRKNSGILPMGLQRSEAAQIELEALASRLAQARADDAEARSLLAQAEATPRAELVNFPVPVDALPARQAQARLGDVVSIVARLAGRYDAAHPDYVEAAKEKASLEDDILQSMRDRAGYSARRVDSLVAEMTRKKAAVSELQNSRESYEMLEKRVAASQEAFNLVTTRSLQESLQSRVDTIDVFLLSRAAPPSDPATPPFWAIVLIGLVAGFALGVAVAVFVELYEGRVRSADVVRRRFRTFVCEIDAARPAPVRKKSSRNMRAVAA